MKKKFNVIFFSIGLVSQLFADIHQVNTGSFYFFPNELSIQLGDTVIWINDGGNHNVNGNINSQTGETYNNPEFFSSNTTNGVGDTIYSHIFTIPGTYNYDCSVGAGMHAAMGMTGTVIVNNTFPEITSILPSSVLAEEIFTINIIGQNTNWFFENPTVEFWGNHADNYTPSSIDVYSNSLIAASFSGLPYPSIYNLEIDGISVPFEVLPNPILQNVSPNKVYTGQNLSLEITGNTSTVFDSLYSDISNSVFIANEFDTIFSSYNQSINYSEYAAGFIGLSSEISIPIEASTGFYDLNVFSETNGAWLSYENSIEIGSSPKIISLSPTNAYQGDDNIYLNIIHENIITDFETDNIWLENDNGNIIYTSFIQQIDDYFQVSLNIPDNTLPGLYSLHIIEHEYNSTVFLEDCFEILSAPPYISYVNPSISEIGQEIPVIVSGINTSFLDYNLTNESIYLTNNFSTITSTSVNVTTNDVIQVEFAIPNSEDFSGSYEMVVNLDSANSIQYQYFTVQSFNDYYLNLNINSGADMGYFHINNLFSGENSYSLEDSDFLDTTINQIIQLADNNCYESEIYFGNYSLSSEIDIISSNSSNNDYCPQTSTFCVGSPCNNINENFIQINGSAIVCGAEGSGMQYSITNMDGDNLYSGNTNGCGWDDCGQSGDYNIPLCLPNGCYNLNILPYETEGASFNIVQNDSLILSGSYDIWSSNYSVGSYQFCTNNVNTSDETIIDGCTDTTAFNYDSSANTDDNSCCYNNIITVNANLTVGAEYNSNVILNISNSNETIFNYNNEIGLVGDTNVQLEEEICGLSDCFNFSVYAETFNLDFSMNDTIISSYSNYNIYGDYLLDSNFCISEEQQLIQNDTVADNAENFGQYYDINGNLIDFDNISQSQEILFYFSCFTEWMNQEYSDYILPIYNNFGCNQEDVFVIIIGAWECGTIHDFVSNYYVQIPIINLSEQWNDPLIEYFDIWETGTPAIYLNNNDTTLERNYSFIETLLLENNANFEPCPMINSISPNISARDQNLDITISGTNVSFSQYYDDLSGGGWHEYSSFQLEHTITSDLIIGNINEDYDSTSQASVYIPNNATYGMYNVKIYDYNSNSYIYLYNGFSVSECINPTAEINLLSTDYTYNSGNSELLVELYFDNKIGDIEDEYFYMADDEWNNWIYFVIQSKTDSSITLISQNDVVPHVYQYLEFGFNNYTCEEYYYFQYTNQDSYIDLTEYVDCNNLGISSINIEPAQLYYDFWSNDSNNYLNIFDTISLTFIDEIEVNYFLNYNEQYFSTQSNNLFWTDNMGTTYDSNFFTESGFYSLLFESESETCTLINVDFNLATDLHELVEIDFIEPSCFGSSDGSILINVNSNFNGQISLVAAELYETLSSSNLSYWFESVDSLTISNLTSGIHPLIFYIDPFGDGFGGLNPDGGVFINDTLVLASPSLNSYVLPYEENFNSGMPCDWDNHSRWTFGEASIVEGPYWIIPEHNQFAVSNDDACNCDMMVDKLISPPLNITNNQDNIILSLSTYFTGEFGSTANIELSNDLGLSWQSIYSIIPSYEWQELSLDISDFISSDTIQIAFKHSDSHSWGSGFAIDDILIQSVCIDDDVDGVCNINEVYGCADSEATNYNADATEDDGSCEYPLVDNTCDITPSGLFVDNIIHERVAFNWSAPSSAPSYYMIRYRPVGTSSWTVMSAGPQNDIPFTGTTRTRYFMEPGTTYQWNIRARVVDENGATVCQSPWSASHQYTTLPACANLTDLSVNSEANLVYFNASKPIGEWGVWQAKGKIREVGSNNYRYLATTVDNYTNQIKYNFTPSTDYEWHTKAWCTGNVDEDGNSDPQYHSGWGEFSAFTTQDPCDKLPTNLSTSSGNNANTAITMSWDTPTSGQPHHYFLELTNETTGQVFSWNNLAGSSTSKTKYGQSSGNQFKWRIRGACGENGTSWATPFTGYEYYTLGGDRLANDSQSNSQLTNISVYPNPSRGEFNISFDLENKQDVYLSITNYLGEVVFTEELKDQQGQYDKTVDLGNKANGIYMMNITTNNQNINQKIVIQ